MLQASPACLQLERQLIARAFARAWAKTGKRIAAKIAMIAITTSSSIKVKPARTGSADRERIVRRPIVPSSSRYRLALFGTQTGEQFPLSALFKQETGAVVGIAHN